MTLLGAYFFWRQQLRWSDFTKAQERANKAAQSETVVVE